MKKEGIIGPRGGLGVFFLQIENIIGRKEQ